MVVWRNIVLGIAAFAVVATTACIKPPPIGYIAPGPQRKGKVIIGVQGSACGGMSWDGTAAAGGGALQVEPFVSSRISIPITGVLAYGVGHEVRYDDFRDGDYEYTYVTRLYGQMRTGVRYRHRRHWFFGGGLTVTLADGTYSSWEVNEPSIRTRGLGVGLSPDFEWGYSRRWNRVGFTFAQRLTWDALPLPGVRKVGAAGGFALLGIHLSNEATLAIFGARGVWAFTMTLGFGLTVLFPWGSAALGVVVSL